MPIELRDHRRRQLVGDEHERSVEVPEQAGRFIAGTQVHAEPTDDVGDVAFALAQVGVVRLVEERGDFLQRALQRRFGVQPLVADDRRCPLDQHRVVEHQELGVEQIGVILAGDARDPRLDVLQLFARSGAGRVEPLEFAPDERSGTRKRRCTPRFSTSARPTPTPGDTPRPFRRTAPPRSRARRARRAPRPPLPRRRRPPMMVIVVPCAAASSSRPMMLLPSISRPPRATRIRDDERAGRVNEPRRRARVQPERVA